MDITQFFNPETAFAVHGQMVAGFPILLIVAWFISKMIADPADNNGSVRFAVVLLFTIATALIASELGMW